MTFAYELRAEGMMAVVARRVQEELNARKALRPMVLRNLHRTVRKCPFCRSR